MGTSTDPFAKLLWHASDRFYLDAVDLTAALKDDPQGTLYRLCHDPACFGKIKPALPAHNRLTSHQQLITAAKAYLVHSRKMTADAVDQLELVLPPSY